MDLDRGCGRQEARVRVGACPSVGLLVPYYSAMQLRPSLSLSLSLPPAQTQVNGTKLPSILHEPR